MMKISDILTAKAAFSTGSYKVLPIAPETTLTGNGTTDNVDFTLGTVVVPGNVGLKVGSMVEIWSYWENTNSATTKTLIVKINGSGVGSSNVTTTTAFYQRQMFQVFDTNTLMTLNSMQGTAGSGSMLYPTITNIPLNGFTVTFVGKWGVANALNEIIRLKMAKLVIYP